MRRLLGLLACSAIALGCGEAEKPSGADSARLKRAGDQLVTKSNYRAKLDLKSDIPGQTIAMNGEMISTVDEKRTHMTVDYTQGDDPQVELEILSIDGGDWVRGGAITDRLPAGKRWLKIEDDSPKPVAIGVFFAYLSGASGFEHVGTEQIRGTPSTHFRGPLDFEDLIKRGGPKTAAGLDKLAGAGDLEATLDVWLDDADLLTRMDVRIGTKGTSGALNISVEILGYDVDDAELDAPKASEVASTSDLAG